MQELSKLSALVELTQNRDYKYPGNCQPLTAPGSIPPGSLNHNCKGSLQFQVQQILQPPALLPTSAHFGAHPSAASTHSAQSTSPHCVTVRHRPNIITSHAHTHQLKTYSYLFCSTHSNPPSAFTAHISFTATSAVSAANAATNTATAISAASAAYTATSSAFAATKSSSASRASAINSAATTAATTAAATATPVTPQLPPLPPSQPQSQQSGSQRPGVSSHVPSEHQVVLAEEEWEMSSADADLLNAVAADALDPMSPRALQAQLQSLDASIEQLQKLRKEATATTLTGSHLEAGKGQRC